MIAYYEMNELKAQKYGAERYCASKNEIYSRSNMFVIPTGENFIALAIFRGGI